MSAPVLERSAADSPAADAAAAGGRSWWRRARVWIALVSLLVLAGVVLALVGRDDGADPLDPGSTSSSGSRALVRVLAGYGVSVEATRSLSTAGADPSASVALLDPDAYSDAQLRMLVRTVHRVVLVDPGVRAVHAVSTLDPDVADDAAADSEPGCDLPAAVAAGRLAVPDRGTLYLGGENCFGGLVAQSGRVVVLGSSDLLRNDHLAGTGVAALDVNLLSDDLAVRTVVWLRPGPDADGPGGSTVWALFPDSAHRAFWWLLVLGAVVVLWRGRRLGAAVTEPLPVVVRAAELVEGHGRLYRRAGAVEAATAALRTATLHRLARRLTLPTGASPEQVAAALAHTTGLEAGAVWSTLGGPVPADDRQLVDLAARLRALEQSARLVDDPPARPGTTDPSLPASDPGPVTPKELP